MVALQLFLALVVLLTSDGAQAQEDERCGYGQDTQCRYKEVEKFCPHLEAAYQKILEALRLLSNGRYYNDRKGLIAIECTLFLTLLAEKRASALGLTVAALKKEVKELKQMVPTCNKHKWRFECFLAFIKVSQAAVELVDAIKAIAEGGFRPSIVKVVDRAMVEYVAQERNQSTIERSLKLGESIMTEIYNKDLIKPYQDYPEVERTDFN